MYIFFFQYQEDVETLNLQTNQKSREEIINNFQKGNVGYFRELQAENRDLRNALQDYQNALELIMSKYRQQTAYFLRESKSQQCKNETNCCNVKQCDCEKIIQKQAKRINEMASVMRTAAKLDEEQECNYLEVIGQYKEENLALREMMDVANKFGSKYNNSIPVESKNVQTDEVLENLSFNE